MIGLEGGDSAGVECTEGGGGGVWAESGTSGWTLRARRGEVGRGSGTHIYHHREERMRIEPSTT
jgi:hypothetical protein